jgi:hypothetical protein
MFTGELVFQLQANAVYHLKPMIKAQAGSIRDAPPTIDRWQVSPDRLYHLFGRA